MQRRLVIDCDLLTGANVSQRNEQNVLVEDLHEGIRLTRMIDVMRSVTPAAAVYTPAVVNRTDSQRLAVSSAIRFGVRDPFTGIFGDLFAGGERSGGEASFAVNSRSFDSQTWGELKFHDHRSSGNDRSVTLDHRLHVGGVFDRTRYKEKPRVLFE